MVGGTTARASRLEVVKKRGKRVSFYLRKTNSLFRAMAFYV